MLLLELIHTDSVQQVCLSVFFFFVVDCVRRKTKPYLIRSAFLKEFKVW